MFSGIFSAVENAIHPHPSGLFDAANPRGSKGVAWHKVALARGKSGSHEGLDYNMLIFQ